MPTPLESGRQTPKIKPLNDRKKQLSQNAIENRRRLKNRFFLCLTVFLLIFSLMGWSYMEKRQLIAEQKQSFQVAEQEQTKAKKETARLKEEINRLNDKEYVANLARSELLYSKKGETIFYFSPED
ncbi:MULTISPECIES: septum formation initiator family protein [Exiguobacterium]|jgi:cell division protein DivIC|uniref:FtsB family cell division protein n=1 Tax=Exiguobacterium TaxID=33986 RepID=UPI00044B9880|nr:MULTISPECIES: septum formation initiator family protein [Exiguobacterium]EZP58062.1 Septum formation initiator [Exiguobacterium sp. RIT341]KQS42221.1 septum formation initiator [Exiguobacterium sp. Leaf196]MDQ6468969.1 septum formation initiator family protein [Exiguobacterium acetylicum]MDT0174333.1 septum formation initiator family protein [Exiguobacterium sp. BRG2]HAB33619.1 septum formation initiator family protein [Exiguobacterium sp.]